MNQVTLSDNWRRVRGAGKAGVARLARRVLPPATVTLRHVEPGVRLTVNLRRHVMFWSRGLSRYEPYTVAALRAAIAPGDTVFDIGANVGFFATILSRWVGPTGRVLAIEPEPQNLSLLRTNLRLNGCGNVRVKACALGESPGVAHFSVDASTGSTGRLGEGATAGELAVDTGAVRLIETPVESIDAIVERLGSIPQVLKLDIEGGEIDALAGATLTLAAHRPAVITELAGERGGDVLHLLQSHGYLLWDLETARPVGPESPSFMVVALPRETADGDRARRVLAALEARHDPAMT